MSAKGGRAAGEREPDQPHSIEAEQAVLGGLLIEPAAWEKVRGILRADDFYRPDHRSIFAAMEALAAESVAFDMLLVANRLEKLDLLKVCGGMAYLGALGRDTPTAVNIAAHAERVRERAQARRLLGLGQEITRAFADKATSEQVIAALQPVFEALAVANRRTAEKHRPITLRPLAEIVAEERQPEWIDGLHEILERRVLAVLAGPRSSLKSLTALTWQLHAALEGVSSIILHAEGRGLDRRAAAFMRIHAPAVDIRSLPVLALERALNLNAAETLEDLHCAISAAGITPALIVIDTLSKYAPGLDENDNAAVALYLSRLSTELRERYSATVLLVTHTGHGDSKRPRGASALMANPDCEFIVERRDPQAMTISVTRERFKDSPALAPLAYRAEVIELGRCDRWGKPVTSLALRECEATLAARPALSGKNQKRLLAELERRSQEPGQVGIWTEGELREIGRGLEMGKQSARDAVHGLRSLGYLTATIGGSRLAHDPGQKGRNGAESQNSARADGAERAEGSI